MAFIRNFTYTVDPQLRVPYVQSPDETIYETLNVPTILCRREKRLEYKTLSSVPKFT